MRADPHPPTFGRRPLPLRGRGDTAAAEAEAGDRLRRGVALPMGARRLALVEAKATRTVLPRMGDPMRLLDPTGDHVTALKRNRSLRLATGRAGLARNREPEGPRGPDQTSVERKKANLAVEPVQQALGLSG